MGAPRYGISLLVFKLISHEWVPVHLWDTIRARREIPYQQAAIYYSVY